MFILSGADWLVFNICVCISITLQMGRSYTFLPFLFIIPCIYVVFVTDFIGSSSYLSALTDNDQELLLLPLPPLLGLLLATHRGHACLVLSG